MIGSVMDEKYQVSGVKWWDCAFIGRWERLILEIVGRCRFCDSFLSVLMVFVRIPIISPARAVRCWIITGGIQCFRRSYRPYVSRAEPRAKSRNLINSARLNRP